MKAGFKNVGLIFTASTGGGHNQAAESIKNQLTSCDFDVHVVDVFRENSKFLEALIEDGYNFISNYVPQLYGGIYKITGQKLPNKQLRKFFMVFLKKKLITLLDTLKPSVIIATHPIFVNLIAELKRDGYTSAACISVVTDLGVHPFYYHPNIDAYITALECTKKQLIQFGVAPEKIYTYGIPVRHIFYNSAKPKHHTNQKFNILLMGGSLGSKKLHRALKSLTKTKYPLDIHVVCGKDHEVKELIDKDISTLPQHISVHTYGFIDNVHELMDSADVLISKPGGLTLTEAICKNLPLIIPFFILGQEKENMEILKQEGLGIHIEDIENLDLAINYYIEHPEALEKITLKMQYIASHYSISKVSDLCVSLKNRIQIA